MLLLLRLNVQTKNGKKETEWSCRGVYIILFRGCVYLFFSLLTSYDMNLKDINCYLKPLTVASFICVALKGKCIQKTMIRTIQIWYSVIARFEHLSSDSCPFCFLSGQWTYTDKCIYYSTLAFHSLTKYLVRFIYWSGW